MRSTWRVYLNSSDFQLMISYTVDSVDWQSNLNLIGSMYLILLYKGKLSEFIFSLL